MSELSAVKVLSWHGINVLAEIFVKIRGGIAAMFVMNRLYGNRMPVDAVIWVLSIGYVLEGWLYAGKVRGYMGDGR